MKYFINGKQFEIPSNQKPFNSGSEGKIYIIGNTVYKIYYPSTLKNISNATLVCHKDMLKIHTKQIILPIDLIYDDNNTCCGYTSRLINHKEKITKNIIKLPSNKFIKNLRILENDATTLGENLILMRDINIDNYIFDENNEIMYIIDISRYTRKINLKIDDYIAKNLHNLNLLIEELLYLELKKLNPTKRFFSKRTAKNIVTDLNERKDNALYSEFLSNELKEYPNIYEYVKRKYK